MCLFSEILHVVASKLSTSSLDFRRFLVSHIFIILRVIYFVGDYKPGDPYLRTAVGRLMKGLPLY